MGIKGLLKKITEGPLAFLGAIGIALPMCLGAIAVVFISFEIVTKTGIWWFPLLTTFLVMLSVPTAFIVEKRERWYYHAQVGHDLFYSENPKYLEKDLRKARKFGIPEDVEARAEYYRNRPIKVEKFTDRREKKRRRKAKLFYVGVGITAMLGIFVTWRAFPFPKNLFQQELITADFTSIFLVVSGILVIITAERLFHRKSFSSFKYAAAIMLGMSIWSAVVAYTLEKRTTYMDGVINVVCLVVFLLTAYVIPAIAGDIRTAEQVSHDKKELKIGMYELGYIKEDELRDF